MKDRKKKILNIAVSALAIGLVSSLMFLMDLDAIGGGPRKTRCI